MNIFLFLNFVSGSPDNAPFLNIESEPVKQKKIHSKKAPAVQSHDISSTDSENEEQNPAARVT